MLCVETLRTKLRCNLNSVADYSSDIQVQLTATSKKKSESNINKRKVFPRPWKLQTSHWVLL